MQVSETIGTYRVLSPLGAGGMSEVWRAEDTKLGREVALKVLPSAARRADTLLNLVVNWPTALEARR